MKCSSPEAYRLLHDGALALAQVEANGMRVDTDYLDRALKETQDTIAGIEGELTADQVWKAWERKYGAAAKLASLPQLTSVLFGVLKHPYPSEEMTATGRYKADEEIIGQVKIPFTESYMRWRKLQKLRGTYLEGLLREVQDGYLHPSFNLHTVVTFRSSSSLPNFQNIPIRNKEIAAIVRRCFVAREGRHIVEIDYSGVEVRVAACYNKDPVLIRYIEDESTDMHRDVAAELFFLSMDFLKEHKEWARKTVRDWVKNRFVFPQFYGDIFFQCAPNLWDAFGNGKACLPDGTPIVKHLRRNGIKKGLGDKFSNWGTGRIETEKGTFMEHVRQVEEWFWKRFKVYTQWKRDLWDKYRRTGQVEMLTGFVCREVMKRNEAINRGIQGSSFHCLLKSLVLLQKWLGRNKMRSLIVGQIHDSMVLDVPPDELEEVVGKAVEIMTVEVPRLWDWIIVPMKAEVDVAPVGGSWHDKQEWKG